MHLATVVLFINFDNSYFKVLLEVFLQLTQFSYH